MQNKTAPAHEIKKLQLEETVLFAINNIPQVDPQTLKQFLDLVNAGGTFGTISHEQILRKMHQVLKYIPDACMQSLLIIVDLLEIEPPNLLTASPFQTNWIIPDVEKNGRTISLFSQTQNVS
jgi:hypothetical protein